MRVTVQKWLTDGCDFHFKYNKGITVPMRTMFGSVIKESSSGKMYMVDLYGKPEPSTTCLHCNRPLTHDVSVYYGIGPVCGQHFYIKPPGNQEELDEYLDTVREQLAKVVWKGWLPKVSIEVQYEEFHTIVFGFGEQEYKVTTSDMTKVEQINRKADYIKSDDVVQG